MLLICSQAAFHKIIPRDAIGVVQPQRIVKSNTNHSYGNLQFQFHRREWIYSRQFTQQLTPYEGACGEGKKTNHIHWSALNEKWRVIMWHKRSDSESKCICGKILIYPWNLSFRCQKITWKEEHAASSADYIHKIEIQENPCVWRH